MSVPSLDIVIPSYNSADTINCCLKSLILAIQRAIETRLLSHSSVHLFIVDDGSTDESYQEIQRLLENCPYPNTLLSQHQQGPSSARNRGTQEGSATWVLYLDSDVELHTEALSELLKIHQTFPSILAFNGYPQYWVPGGSWITQYTNISLCYQLSAHGDEVNTAFTSLCLMSRKAWQLMDGWDGTRTSRYSDDIQSRWHFPPCSIRQCFGATFIHHKHVKLWGLIKHRFNLGFHYRNSIPAASERHSGTNITLHLRYPLSVLSALTSILATLLMVVEPGLWWLQLIWMGTIAYVNIPLIRFIDSFDTEHVIKPFHKLSVFGLSYCEGFAMGLGLFTSLYQDILKWSSNGDT